MIVLLKSTEENMHLEQNYYLNYLKKKTHNNLKPPTCTHTHTHTHAFTIKGRSMLEVMHALVLWEKNLKTF